MRKMIDLKRTNAEKADAMGGDVAMPSVSSAADYPYGLSICLTDREMALLDLADDVEAGDMLDFRAMAVVTNVNKSDNNGVKSCRVELQISHIMELENESTE